MASYNSVSRQHSNSPSPYASGDPYYNESSGFITPTPVTKKRTSNWIKFGIPVAIIIIVGAVVGSIFGSKAKKNAGGGSGGGAAAESSAASIKAQVGRYATGTNSFMRPVYPSTTNTAAFTTPTFVPNVNAISWPEDPFKPASPDKLTVRPDRPRLIAPAYKWQVLPGLIKTDPYLKGWNDTIFGNASQYMSLQPVTYKMDGANGILDNAREIKMRIKAFAYVYRMTNDTKWVDRAWEELKNAAGNGTKPFGPADGSKWNPAHFLDTAELTAAFAIAYDWLYAIWTDDQKGQIRSTMIQYGLSAGQTAYGADPNATGWWKTNTLGNWNCVCNGGLTMGALAIIGDDTTGAARQLLGLTVDNAKQNCAMAPSTDGTWAETSDYWYFGTTGHAEMSSSLITATGSHYGLLDVNPSGKLSGTFHMYAYGATSLFNWGDHGPPKFSSTANAMFLYGEYYKQPQFILFQRDQFDAAEPSSMFWYDPSVSGAFWDGTPLDMFFDDPLTQWASMRSSWTDSNALYVAMKAGKNQGHQTHNDLDAGDFVLDCLGTRFAGELGSSDYLSKDYFSSDATNSVRWLYYRKRTEGQNTIVVGKQNQKVDGAPTVKHDSSKTTQGSSTVIDLPGDSTAYWTADLTTAYSNVQSFKRGVRLLNARKQVLIQDDINAQGDIEWRMHTNATVAVNGQSATLTIGDKTVKMTILNAPDAQISTGPATRYPDDPTPPDPDPENPGVTVVSIKLAAGTHSLQVLFNPQWPGMSDSDFKTPGSVPIDNWSLTSHQ
jgi:hypothetical protein